MNFSNMDDALCLILVLTPADDEHHVDKRGNKFKVPFVCGARNLGEALRRIAEGAAMIRTKGEAGTGEQIKFQILIDFSEIFIFIGVVRFSLVCMFVLLM